MMRAACSRVSLAAIAAAKESETKISGIKSFVFIARRCVDRQAAAEIPKHLWPPARLFRRAQSKGFHEAWYVHNVGKCNDCGFHDVELAEHRRRENVHARIVLEQVFDDVATAHMECPA